MKLVKIDENNFIEAAKLSTNKEGVGGLSEAFVMSNIFSIAQAQFLPTFQCYGIVVDDKIIGLTMYGLEGDEPWIYRMMIDIQHQGKGLGKKSLALILKEITSQYGEKDIYIGFEPENTRAKHLYQSLGFVDTGRIEDGELIFVFKHKFGIKHTC